MSRIDDLIQQLCPNGVDSRPLGEVFEMKAGRFIAASDISAVADGAHRYPCYGGNGSRGWVPISTHDGSFLLIGRQGALCGNVQRTSGRFFATEHAVVCSPRQEVDVDWAYHLLNMMNLNQYATKSAQPGLAVGNLARIKMPFPPFEVQREVAQVLDLFQSLEAELEAELEARRRQYAHYRDLLLSFPDSRDERARWVTMGEIGSMFGGLTGKSKVDFHQGNARFVTYMNVFRNIATDVEPDDWVRMGDHEHQRRVHFGDVLFTGSSETPDECGMSSVVTTEPADPLYLNSFCIGFRLDDPSVLHPAFSKHLFRSSSMRRQIGRTASGVTRFNVSKAKLATVRLPIPPVAEQKQIAAILDKFDALVNDLSIGLPAELAARRKQYEYYRDRLLTFREVA